MEILENSNRLLSLAEVQAVLGVSRSTCWKLVKAGELKVLHIGRAVRVTGLELSRFISAKVGGAS